MEQQSAREEINGAALVIQDLTPTDNEILDGEVIGYVPSTPAKAYTLKTVPYPERLKEAATLQTNDVGLGQRLALHFKEKLVFVFDELTGERAWHVYNEKIVVWERDISGELAKELAIQVTNSLNDELGYISTDSDESNSAQRKLQIAQSFPDGESRDKAVKAAEAAIARAKGSTMAEHLKFIKGSNSGDSHWKASLEVAKGLLKRPATDFDADPTCINTPQGLLNLRTLQLTPPSPHNLVTMITKAHCIPGATHPDVEKAIARLDIAGHLGLSRFTQLYLGSGLTALPAAKTVFYQNGVPDSAKSTVILSAIQALNMTPATGYATTVDPKVFCRSNGDANADDTKLHGYRGKRMLFADEADKAGLLGELFKKWASGEPITTRAQREMAFQWYPVGTLIMAGNGVIGIPTDDAGVVRRFISSNLPTPVEKVDEAVRTRMATPEAHAAIFAWLVQGAYDWLTAGATRDAFCITERMIEETAGYVGNADPFVDFLEECVETNPQGDYLPVKFGVWKEIYKDWCQTTGSKQLPPRVLKEYLERYSAESTPTMARHDGWALAGKTRLMMGIAMKRPDYAYLERRGHIVQDETAPTLTAVKLAA